mgnify:CR=1 FL=1
MKVLSLFDGMSCGRIALDQLGIPVETYYASEIDKYAIQVSQANYPDIQQVGDICNLDPKDYQDVDLMLAGSPCQGFSFAGKQLAFDDPRSALFFEFIRLLKAIKPKYFLLENVRMKKEFLQVISEQVSACYPEITFGIEPLFINSSLLSAQSRQRYYWTNIPNIKQPEDRGIVLRDILEDDYDSERDKAHCIDANYYKGANVEQYKTKHRRQLVNKPIKVGMNVEQVKIRKHVGWKETKPEQMLELRKDNKSNAVSSVSKDSLVVNSYREVRTDEAKAVRKKVRQQTGKDHTPFRAKKLEPRKDGKVGTVTPSLNKDHEISIEKEDLTWRKLTPLECERLQTVPDDYTNHVSNTQRYKMLGNGWTVEVIKHIFNNMEI